MAQLIDDYIDFQSASPTPFHVTTKLREIFLAAGFQELAMESKWQLKSNSYFVIHPDGKSIIALLRKITRPAATFF